MEPDNIYIRGKDSFVSRALHCAIYYIPLSQSIIRECPHRTAKWDISRLLMIVWESLLLVPWTLLDGNRGRIRLRYRRHYILYKISSRERDTTPPSTTSKRKGIRQNLLNYFVILGNREILSLSSYLAQISPKIKSIMDGKKRGSFLIEQ
jgi:hypothetical protein